MKHILTTLHKRENGAEYLGYMTCNIIGTHVRFLMRNPGEERWTCVDDRDTPVRYTSLLGEFMNSGYTIID